MKGNLQLHEGRLRVLPRHLYENIPSFGGYFAKQLSIFHQFCMFTLYGQIFL